MIMVQIYLISKLPQIVISNVYSNHKLSISFLPQRRHAIFPTPSYEKNRQGSGLTGPTFPGIVSMLKRLRYPFEKKPVVRTWQLGYLSF